MERKITETAKLTGRYAKLSDDLRKAAEIGIRVAENTSDSGTCNFDSVALSLKGWVQSKVEAAANQAGICCSDWTLWGSKFYVFPLIGCWQANARTASAEAMRDFLKAAGYEATVYYQMD